MPAKNRDRFTAVMNMIGEGRAGREGGGPGADAFRMAVSRNQDTDFDRQELSQRSRPARCNVFLDSVYRRCREIFIVGQTVHDCLVSYHWTIIPSIHRLHYLVVRLYDVNCEP